MLQCARTVHVEGGLCRLGVPRLPLAACTGEQSAVHVPGGRDEHLTGPGRRPVSVLHVHVLTTNLVRLSRSLCYQEICCLSISSFYL